MTHDDVTRSRDTTPQSALSTPVVTATAVAVANPSSPSGIDGSLAEPHDNLYPRSGLRNEASTNELSGSHPPVANNNHSPYVLPNIWQFFQRQDVPYPGRLVHVGDFPPSLFGPCRLDFQPSEIESNRRFLQECSICFYLHRFTASYFLPPDEVVIQGLIRTLANKHCFFVVPEASGRGPRFLTMKEVLDAVTESPMVFVGDKGDGFSVDSDNAEQIHGILLALDCGPSMIERYSSLM